MKSIGFGTIIENKYKDRYVVLKYKPEFVGHIQSTKVCQSVLGNQEGGVQSNSQKVKGKILVFNENTEMVNWYSLEDFQFKVVSSKIEEYKSKLLKVFPKYSEAQDVVYKAIYAIDDDCEN